MSKYDSLHVPPTTDIKGIRYTKTYSAFVPAEDEQPTVISGFPACPECGCLLEKHFGNDRWVCSGKECQTVWTSEELVEAVEREKEVNQHVIQKA